MKNLSLKAVASLLILVAPAYALAADEVATKGVNAFKACYGSANATKSAGAPTIQIDVVVDSAPEQKATGKATVNWGSVGPSFKPIEAPISGPWYSMCTMKSCSIRFDFTSAPGAREVKGMLVIPNWGAPGIFKYEFDGKKGEVEQKATVCN
jgi:hypothetical protein